MTQHQNERPQPEQSLPTIDPYEIIASDQQQATLNQVTAYVLAGHETVRTHQNRALQGRSWRAGGAVYQGSYDDETGTTKISKLTNKGNSYESFSFHSDSEMNAMTVSWSASHDLSHRYRAIVTPNARHDDKVLEYLTWPGVNGRGAHSVRSDNIDYMINDKSTPGPVRAKALEVSQQVTRDRLEALLPELQPPSPSRLNQLSRLAARMLTRNAAR